MTKFKIFSDKRYLPDGARHIELLYPFWGAFRDSNGIQNPDGGGLWRQDFFAVNSFISLTDDLSLADFAILPGDWKQYQRRKQESLAHEFADLVGRSGKPLLVIYQHDSAEQIPLKNAIVLRTSLYRSQKTLNEYAMPAWHTDYVREYSWGTLHLRPKNNKPVVGFCGHAIQNDNVDKFKNFKNSLQRWVRGNAWFDYLKFRQKVLGHLGRCSGIATNFILRDQFMGGEQAVDGQKWSGLQEAFIENLIGSDYIVCVRGAGNYSFRFYEALCCGRIPILIDTDCVLPFEGQIDWPKHIIRIDQRQISDIGDIVLEFHNCMSDEDFINRQKSCRELTLTWLSPQGYFSNFLRLLSNTRTSE